MGVHKPQNPPCFACGSEKTLDKKFNGEWQCLQCVVTMNIAIEELMMAGEFAIFHLKGKPTLAVCGEWTGGKQITFHEDSLGKLFFRANRLYHGKRK